MSDTSYSQAHQDTFVLFATNCKRGGYFVEIGSNDPIVTNNTYLLENKYDWKGLMVEYDGSFLDKYKAFRPHSIHEINDARNVNYASILQNNTFPMDIDYLQLDLDVNNRSTLDVLELFDKTIFNHYRFTCLTIEHDIYSGNFYNTRAKSREILASRGYTLVFPDVCVFWEGSYKPFEDWYVHPELAPHALSYVTTESLNCSEIANRIKKHY
jgi:hypothetical protein